MSEHLESTSPCIAFVCREFPVTTDSETFSVIYGNHSEGGFCCVPSRGISVVMPDANDIHNNAEKLSKKLDLRTAYIIACEIKKQCGDKTGMALTITELDEDIAILEQPWPTALKGLSTRASNCLSRSGNHYNYAGKILRTVRDVATLTLSDIHMMRNAINTQFL